MAQPVFDDHPLEEYFRQAGEVAEDMPGTHSDPPTPTLQGDGGESRSDTAVIPESFQLPEFLSRAVQAINAFLSSSSQDIQFAERFKYDVISSSLLSSALSGTPRHGSIPDRLPEDSSDHSRAPSHPDQAEPSSSQSRFGQLDSMQFPTALVSVAIVALSAEYYFVTLFLLTVALVFHQLAKSQASRADAMNLTVNALNELISAGNVWDSAVNQAMTLVEKEERRSSPFFGPTSPRSPFSSLRVALQSSLHTTQNQCDNVRHLLSALTSPAQASQLSEMYAPTSPSAPSFLQLESMHSRPMSEPVSTWRKRTSSLPQESVYNKRATWNGSYVALAQASNPLVRSLSARKAEKRRSDLSFLFNTAAPARHPMSAPTSPLPLEKLSEEDEEEVSSEGDHVAPHIPELSAEYFGMAALDLRRKRQSAGLQALKMSSQPPSYSRQANLPLPPSQSASRFTLPQTSRNPLSLSALRLALHGSLAAKRYACSHLLALRFEDDDATYWEDVRSMMALLTTTFSDASARLTEALDENEKRRIKDERPSISESVGRPSASKSMQEMVGFAPMPSHLTRFAAHVDAITTALDDARTHLEQCVAALRDPLKQNASADPFLDSQPVPIADSPALQAYDRLRKELGYALRECERGRERLLNTIMPPSSNTVHLTDGEDEAENTPSLIPDTATSDGGVSATSSHLPVQIVHSEMDPSHGLGLEVVLDDATEHLLMSTSSSHLPPPGIEQVYEADSGVVGLFTRERSRLSREERIKMAKEKRRESGGRGHLAFAGDKAEEVTGAKWGPGGEVVQELKDVIWKVSEKKRRLSEQVRVESAVDVVSVVESESVLERRAAVAMEVETHLSPIGEDTASINADSSFDIKLDTSRTITPLEFPTSNPNLTPSLLEEESSDGLAYLDS